MFYMYEYEYIVYSEHCIAYDVGIMVFIKCVLYTLCGYKIVIFNGHCLFNTSVIIGLLVKKLRPFQVLYMSEFYYIYIIRQKYIR